MPTVQISTSTEHRLNLRQFYLIVFVALFILTILITSVAYYFKRDSFVRKESCSITSSVTTDYLSTSKDSSMGI